MRVVITGFRLPVHFIHLPLGGDDALHAFIIDAGLRGLEEAGRAANKDVGAYSVVLDPPIPVI
jgi:hypothetical protein